MDVLEQHFVREGRCSRAALVRLVQAEGGATEAQIAVWLKNRQAKQRRIEEAAAEAATEGVAAQVRGPARRSASR